MIVEMAKARPAIPRATRDALLSKLNHRCAVCGKDRPQAHPIDEDPSNNDPITLLPLCTNCHLIDQRPRVGLTG
jgi:predicted restriction endonuclease